MPCGLGPDREDRASGDYDCELLARRHRTKSADRCGDGPAEGVEHVPGALRAVGRVGLALARAETEDSLTGMAYGPSRPPQPWSGQESTPAANCVAAAEGSWVSSVSEHPAIVTVAGDDGEGEFVLQPAPSGRVPPSSVTPAPNRVPTA